MRKLLLKKNKIVIAASCLAVVMLAIFITTPNKAVASDASGTTKNMSQQTGGTVATNALNWSNQQTGTTSINYGSPLGGGAVVNNAYNHPNQGGIHTAVSMGYDVNFNLPKCVTSAQVRLGGDFQIAFGGSSGGSLFNYSPSVNRNDYPEVFFGLFSPKYNGSSTTKSRVSFAYEPEIGAPNGSNTFNPNSDRQTVGVNSDGSVSLQFYVSMEIEDTISNLGRQTKYLVSGTPNITIKYDDSCDNPPPTLTCNLSANRVGTSSDYNLTGYITSSDMSNTYSLLYMNDGLNDGQYDTDWQNGSPRLWLIENVTSSTTFTLWLSLGSTSFPCGITINPPPSPSGVTCVITLDRSGLNPGQEFSAEITVTNNGSSALPNSTLVSPDSWQLPDDTFTDTLIINSGDPIPVGTENSVQVNQAFKAPSTSRIFKWSVRLTSTGAYLAECQAQITVNPIVVPPKLNKPYVRATNNDVWAGADFKTGQTCTASLDDATIKTSHLIKLENTVLGVSGVQRSYGGSGSEYGAFSTGGVIFNDSSDLGFTGRNGLSRQINAGLSTFDLVFPNVKLGPPLTSSYDSFTNSPLCLEDYYDSYIAKADITVNNNGNLASAVSSTATGTTKIIKYDGSDIMGLTIPSGANVVVLSNRTVNITGNITYSGAGTLENPTSFTLVVKGGNITVQDKAVAKLDGTYIAQPSGSEASATGGQFNTCAALTPPADTSDTDCNKQLAINGQVIAQKLILNRLYGSIGYNRDGAIVSAVDNACLALKEYDDSADTRYLNMYGASGDAGQTGNCAAELFDFDPNLYLSTAKSVSQSGGGGYNQVQSLQELPPIY